MVVVGCLVAFYFRVLKVTCRLAWPRLKVSNLANHGEILWVDISSVVLLMRVHALWQKNRLLGIFLAALAVVSTALGVALLSVRPSGVSVLIVRSRYGPYTFYRVP